MELNSLEVSEVKGERFTYHLLLRSTHISGGVYLLIKKVR